MGVELGQKVRDKVSGFEGIAVCRHIYLEGCERISVQPLVDKEGKLPEAATFDEPQLEVIEDTEISLSRKGKKEPEGPGGTAHYPPKEKTVPESK
jgi:hypothetical protein